MTRKDYVAIASTLAATRPDSSHYTDAGLFGCVHARWHFVAVKMADMLAQDNPRFDRGRFLTACGVQS